MPPRNPGARARALGAQLRECREQLDLTLRAAADVIGWDKSTLSRIENGGRQPAIEEVAQLLGVYRVTGELRDEVLQMARAVDEPGWWEHGNRGLPRSTTALASYEAEATRITDWAPLIMPGLLQTPDYAREWLLADGIEPEAAALRVDARMDRQRILSRQLRYTAFVGESALRTPVGGGETMARQLAALREAGSRQNMSVRVVPSHVGPHRGQIGVFHALEFAVTPPVVLIELLRSSLFMDEPWQTEPYLETVAQLGGVALGETESTRLITRMQARWSERERTGQLAQVEL